MTSRVRACCCHEAAHEWSGPVQVCSMVALGSEQVADRSSERELKVPADYVCRGSGRSCDDGLSGPPLMSPTSAPMDFTLQGPLHYACGWPGTTIAGIAR